LYLGYSRIARPRTLAALPAMSLIPFAPLTRDLQIARPHHHATFASTRRRPARRVPDWLAASRSLGRITMRPMQSTRRRPRTPCCGMGRRSRPDASDFTKYC